MSRVKMPAARPNSVELISSIAASSESNGMTETTGAKISSHSTRISRVALLRMVGISSAPRRSSACDEPGAAGDGVLNPLFGARRLGFADHGTDGGLGIVRIADVQLCGRRGKLLQERLEHLRVHEQALRGSARLAGAAERGVRHARCGAIEIAVLAHQRRGDAPQFESNRTQAHVALQLLANRGAASEGVEPNLLVLHQPAARLRSPAPERASDAPAASRRRA